MTTDSESSKSMPEAAAKRLRGDETFQPEPFTVQEFWQWAHSDLLSNTLRGVLAEFLVAKAVGTVVGIRTEWDAYDVKSPDGVRIEVKSAAYVQSWQQDKPSKISFDIAPKTSWDSQTNTFDAESSRSADVYVFALLHEQDRNLVNPTELNQWTFYVLSTARLNELGSQKTITLGSLNKLNPIATDFAGLAKTVRESAKESTA